MHASAIRIMAVRRSLSIVSMLLASACSGATPTELFAPISEDDNPTSPIVGGDSSGSSSSSGGGSAPGTSSGAPNDGTDNGGTSGGQGSTPPTPPPAGNACVVDKEPNDGPEATQWFTRCFKGTVKKGDVDHASISAPLTAQKIEIEHEEDGGDVSYRLYINGLLYDEFSGDGDPFIPVFAGGTYSFEMSAAGGGAGARSYELVVKFE